MIVPDSLWYRPLNALASYGLQREVDKVFDNLPTLTPPGAPAVAGSFVWGDATMTARNVSVNHFVF